MLESALSKLDDLDRSILDALQDDARASFADIARKFDVSEATIHLRVKKMKDAGVIKGFYTIVVPEKVGKELTAFIYIKVDPLKYAKVLEHLLTIRDLYEIYDVTGEYYAVIKVRTHGGEGLAKILDALGKVDGIISTMSMVVLRTLKDELKIEL
jgi:Lrp/AsnC family transcriptional regulator, regulator for asnA, asnC and gidA